MVWVPTIQSHEIVSGLFHTPEANRCLPFVRLWYTTASEYVWHDANGNQHTITQAEGGEQGDPLMPALFSLGQEPALQAVQAQLQPGEVIYAFLGDIYAVVQPERVRAVYDLLARHLEAHARIRLNQGKTRIWNRGGHAPPNIHTLGPDTWVGNRELPPNNKASQSWGHPLVPMPMRSTSCKTPQPATGLSLNSCHTSKTSKQHGCCSSTLPAPAATICSGCYRRRKQPPLQNNTTLTSAAASRSFCKQTRCQ